jgi:Family of unknown function (DUF6152)
MILLSRRATLLLAASGVLIPAGRALAHHGWGSYDAENPLELTGTIEAMSYEWPHAAMMLATADKTWEVVLGPPSRTRSRGLSDDIAVVGTECTVMGYPHRTRDVEIRVEWVRVNGETFQMR